MLCITAVPNNFDSLKNWPEESFCNDDYCFIFDVEKQNLIHDRAPCLVESFDIYFASDKTVAVVLDYCRL